MKKYLILASAALVALAACNKEENQTSETSPEEETVLLTFTSERPALDTDTKTEWDSTNKKIVWSTGDKIRVGYQLDGNWMGQSAAGTAKFYQSDAVSIDKDNANYGTFTVPVSGSAFTDPETSGSYQFFAVSPASAVSTDVTDPTAKNITLPASQTPGSNTFDKAADIMVGNTSALSLDGIPTDPMVITWTRLVAHADITFSNLDFDGAETVNKITLTFNTEAKVAGSFAVNIPAATTGTGSTNVLTLSGSGITSSASSAEAWACVLPVTFTSLSVELMTDKAVYTRDITSISKTFRQNARNTLTVNMSTADREEIELLADGNYVIAAKSSDTYYAISKEANGSSSRRDRSEITTSSFDPANYSAESPYTAANGLVWTVTNVTGGVKINLAENTSSYLTYGSGTLPLGASGSTFVVDKGSTTGTFTLANSSKYVAMNGSYGFGCYASGTGVSDLYFIPATGTPTLTFPVTSKNVSATTTSVSFSYSAVFLTADPVVSVTSDTGSAVSNASISAGTVTVTLNENTTASDKSITLTVSSTGASSVVLTITQAAAVGDAEDGDIMWAEAFGGFSANDVPLESNASTTVYGSGSVTYTCVNGDTDTKIYAQSTAGGSSPELLISKNGGSFTVSGIPSGNASGMTLTFKSNNGCTVSSGTSGVTVSSDYGSYTYGITISSGVETLSLTFTNSAGSNTRIDNFSLVAGAPIPGITVSTSAASATQSEDGTTATLNGSLALVNGATNANVTEAGFYYKLSAAAAYTKVTCASAPTSTTSFSYNLTGLTKDATYTYYAYAIYNSGSEVTGKATEKTFTPTQGAAAQNDYTYVFTSKSWTATLGGSAANWTSGSDGGGFSNDGVQVSTTYSGANATSPTSFTNISKIVVKYHTNKSSGAGTLKVKVGSNTEKSNSWAYSGKSDGRTTDFTSTFTFATPETGNVKLTANTTTNSIYVVSITITAD